MDIRVFKSAAVDPGTGLGSALPDAAEPEEETPGKFGIRPRFKSASKTSAASVHLFAPRACPPPADPGSRVRACVLSNQSDPAGLAWLFGAISAPAGPRAGAGCRARRTGGPTKTRTEHKPNTRWNSPSRGNPASFPPHQNMSCARAGTGLGQPDSALPAQPWACTASAGLGLRLPARPHAHPCLLLSGRLHVRLQRPRARSPTQQSRPRVHPPARRPPPLQAFHTSLTRMFHLGRRRRHAHFPGILVPPLPGGGHDRGGGPTGRRAARRTVGRCGGGARGQEWAENSPGSWAVSVARKVGAKSCSKM